MRLPRTGRVDCDEFRYHACPAHRAPVEHGNTPGTRVPTISSAIEHLGSLDRRILAVVNGHAGASPVLDGLVILLADNYLLKSLPPLLVWWGLWFAHPGDANRVVRARLLAALLVTVSAIAAGRLLATLLPFRVRPLSDPGLGISHPLGFDPKGWDAWSSLPSDHALLFFALATSICLIRRGPGVLLLVHAALVVCLPRVYLGLHYPGDILAGAVVGTAIAWATLAPVSRLIARAGLLEGERRYAYLFYPVLFFLTFQAASMFESLRGFLSGAYSVARAAAGDAPGAAASKQPAVPAALRARESPAPVANSRPPS